MNKKVLMAGGNYYTSPFQVGSHHYARAFEKLGYEVLYISSPITPLHDIFANNIELKERERIYKNGGEKIGNITYYVPKALFSMQNKPLLRSKFVLNHWKDFSFPNIINYIKKKCFDDVNILWFDSPLFHFLFKNVKHKQSILRLADYSKGYKSLIAENHYRMESELANRVDKIIYTAKNIKDKYKEIKNKSRMLYVPNGIDFEFFEKADKSFPEEFKNIPEPRIIYVGAIHEWFDVDLVYYCASKLPSYNFVIIGLPKINLSNLKNLKNIYILGIKPYSRIPGFLTYSQVGIIPFDIRNYSDLVNSINPLKLYEYLACGLPVVSVKWEEILCLEHMITLCDTKDEFLEGIKKPKKILFNLSEFSWDKKLYSIIHNG